MSSWTLVVWYAIVQNNSVAFTIQNIPTYEECNRVWQEVYKMRPVNNFAVKCIEVKKEKLNGQ